MHAVLLPPSLNGLDKYTWLSLFEQTNFVFLSLNSRLKYITITLTVFYLSPFVKDLIYIYCWFTCLPCEPFCSASWRRFHIFSIWVFLIKQHFQKGTLKIIEETIELQKKQNCIKANKLILNSSLAFNYKCGISQESLRFLQNQCHLKLKVVYNRRK